ncbi:MAG: hypothetical protein U1F36_03045 [Planctomycetota bacterium]
MVDAANGPGTDFSDLLPAMDAASSGDTILLRPHPTALYNTPATRAEFISKSLRSVGLGASPVRVWGALQFRGAPGDHLIVLANLDMSNSLVDIQDCLGLVICDRLISTGVPGGSVRLLADSGRVVVANSRGTVWRGPAVYPNRVSLWLQNCYYEDLHSNPTTTVQMATLYAVESEVWLIGTELRGGTPLNTSMWDRYYDWGLAVGHVSANRPGRAYLGPGCVIAGAPRPGGRQTNTCTSPTHENSVKTSHSPYNSSYPPAYLFYDPTTTFEGCRETGGHELAHEFPAVLPGEALRGQRQSIDLWGPSTSVLAVFASFAHTGDPIVLPIGDVWLDPDLVVHVGSAAVDANHRATLSTTIPPWIAPGEVLVYQAVALSPAQSWEISPPGIAVVR